MGCRKNSDYHSYNHNLYLPSERSPFYINRYKMYMRGNDMKSRSMKLQENSLLTTRNQGGFKSQKASQKCEAFLTL
jgi:hypothetical protein